MKQNKYGDQTNSRESKEVELRHWAGKTSYVSLAPETSYVTTTYFCKMHVQRPKAHVFGP